MNKWTLGWLAMVASTALQAASLHVKTGETHQLDAQQKEWVLDELILEDNATLLIPAGAGQVQIDAAKAVIGNGVSIVAKGEASAAGKAGIVRDGQADKCMDGIAGGHGDHGAVGGDGTILNLTLRIAQLGSLSIDTEGGDGGVGGAGGKGQDAGEFDTCNAPKGGEGGRGGDGGDGGSGGHVRVFYSLLPESGISGSLGDRININAVGGKGGTGGEGGKGGEGGPGKFVNMKTLSGSKKWMAGGKAGADGVAGKTGRDGAKGQVLVQQDLRSRMDELAQQQSAEVQTLVEKKSADLTTRTEQLEKQLDTVMKKLEQMEAQMNALMKKSATPAAAAP